MNIFTRIYNALIGSTKEPVSTPQTKITGYEQYGYPYLVNDTKKSEYLEELRGWVSACVTSIADEVASIDLKLYTFKNGEITEVDESPIIDLLYKVNEFTTRFDHFWITQVYLELTGEAPWYLEKQGGKITGIYILKPDRITQIIDKSSQLISGYKYDLGLGKYVILSTDEVLFLKYPDPSNPLRGKGTLSMAARPVDIDNFSEEWNKSFYKNAARPDSVLKVKTDSMTDEQRIRLKQSLKEHYQGIDKAHKTMVLFGEMEWQQIGVNQKEMDFLEQQKFSRDKILGIFRVPKAVVAQTEGVNFASAQVAQYTFARWCIKPKLERLVQQLNEFLIPQFSNSQTLYLDFDNPVPEDVDTAIKKYNSGLTTGWLTINEVREMENLPPVEGGDVVRVGGLPVDGQQQVPQKELKLLKNIKTNSKRLREIHSRDKTYFETEKTKEKFVQTVENLIIEKIKERKKEKKFEIKKKSTECNHEHDETGKIQKLTSAEEKLAFWQMKDILFTKYFPAMKEIMVKVFQLQYKEVVGKLLAAKTVQFKNGTNIYNKIKLNEKKENERILNVTIPLLEELFRDAGSKTFEALGIDVDLSPKREEVQKLILDYGRTFAKSVNVTTNEAIKQHVYDNFSKGGTLTDLKAKLAEYFDSSEQYRADRIARSETVRYSTAATEQAFIDSGVVKAKQWFVNPDACSLCEPLKGKIVDLGQDYFKIGDSVMSSDGKEFKVQYTDIKSPPLHVNCFVDHQIPIFTSKGWKKIIDIKVGDLVLTHKGRFRKVTKLIRSKGYKSNIVTLNIDTKGFKNKIEELTITENHPILINGRWVKAKNIKAGDKISVLSNVCEYCGNKIPFNRKVCNHSCQSKLTTQKQWSDDNHRRNMSKKLSERLLNEWSGDLRDKHLKQLSSARKNILECPLSKIENQIKSRQSCGRRNYGKSWLEEKVGWALNENDIEFEKQYPIKRESKDRLGRDRYYFADFKLKNKDILIECDGYFHKFNEERDIERQLEIEKQGYTILRFDTDTILRNLPVVVNEVQRVLANHNHEYEFTGVEVKTVKHWIPKKSKNTYNFSVEEDESYLAKGYVVHNCRCDLIPIWYNSTSNADYKRLDLSGKDTPSERRSEIWDNIEKHIESKGNAKVTPAEKSSLDYYVGYGFKKINDYLRFGEFENIDDKIEIEKELRNVESSIKKNKIDEDYIVFRGILMKDMTEKKLFDMFKVGSEIKDLGFVSTSFSEEVTTIFRDVEAKKTDAKVLFSIKIAKNSEAMIINRANVGMKQEFEVLINKNSTYSIENIVKFIDAAGDTAYRIDTVYKGTGVSKSYSEKSKKKKSNAKRFNWTLEDFEIIK